MLITYLSQIHCEHIFPYDMIVIRYFRHSTKQARRAYAQRTGPPWNRYAKGTAFWRTPVSTDQDDPAVRAVLERFSRYPQWEGRCILTRSQTEQLWFYLSIDGENGYRSPCTFEKYDKDGRSLAYAVVQYANDQLILLEGEFPMEDEWFVESFLISQMVARLSALIILCFCHSSNQRMRNATAITILFESEFQFFNKKIFTWYDMRFVWFRCSRDRSEWGWVFFSFQSYVPLSAAFCGAIK